MSQITDAYIMRTVPFASFDETFSRERVRSFRRKCVLRLSLSLSVRRARARDGIQYILPSRESQRALDTRVCVYVCARLNEIVSYRDALFRQLTSIFIPFSRKFSVKSAPKRKNLSVKSASRTRKENERRERGGGRVEKGFW